MNGVRYGHVIDPRTGWPASGVMSASVIASSAAAADALSTAFLIGGPALAERYCASHPGVLAIVTPDDERRGWSASTPDLKVGPTMAARIGPIGGRRPAVMTLSSFQQLALVLLRTSIGWHFAYEGYFKLLYPAWSRGGAPLDRFSSLGYLRGATGPLADLPLVRAARMDSVYRHGGRRSRCSSLACF